MFLDDMSRPGQVPPFYVAILLRLAQIGYDANKSSIPDLIGFLRDYHWILLVDRRQDPPHVQVLISDVYPGLDAWFHWLATTQTKPSYGIAY